MSFKIGDRVRVQSKHFPEQNGLTGTIVKFDLPGRLNVRIKYDPDQQAHPYMARYNYNPGEQYTNRYAEVDLIHDDNYLMEDCEFTLDEILQSKELIEGLEHDNRRNQ